MNTSNVIQVLLSIKNIGNKTIDSINKEVLFNVETVSDIEKIITDLSFNNKKIVPPSISVLDKIYNRVLDLEECNKKNNVITINKFDEDFPVSLKSLNGISSPCVMLYCKGNIACLNQNSVAIIGTRDVSPLGKKIGIRLGEYVAEKGFNVVSGLALGADTCGHRGCLNIGGKTIAVLGNGLSMIYPAKNKSLAEEILEKEGCLITEYSLNTEATSFRLVARDRLQAALVNGIIVIEMGLKSGTYNAINIAIKLHKPVACYNYNEEHYDNFPQSVGNRAEIKKKTVEAIRKKDEIDLFLGKMIINYSLF